LSVTAEESGLLGAEYFASHPPCTSTAQKVCGSVTALNFDIMNVWGATRDVVAIGFGMSEILSDLVSQAASDEHLTITPDPTPDLGHLFRSDQLIFALRHIPSITLSSGTKYKDKPSNYWINVTETYTLKNYHQTSDQYHADWSMDGIIQQVRVMMRVAYQLTVTEVRPTLDNPELLPD
jgi:Zn-dependent M28 family amino/carboxypeptidase